ncbi:MAG: LppX_LprAFG lipoprotein, partial [Anaerolineae bacterium]
MRHNWWLAATALMILGLVVTACGPSQAELDAQATEIAAGIFATQTAEAPTDTPAPTPTFTPTSTPTVTPMPTPTLPSAQALLEAALGILETESYHFGMDMQMKATEGTMTMEIPFTFVGDFEAPDRVQGSMSMTMFGMTIEMEVITIGETAYATNPDTGEWEVGAESAAPFSPEDFAGIDPADIEDLTVTGEVSLDGTTAYHLQGIASAQDMGPAMADIEGELQLEYWIGVADGRLRQNTVEGELLAPGEAGTIGLVATTTYSDYGQAVAIEPPELPTPIPVATFAAAAATPAPPVPEAMGELEPGWSSYMTEGEVENIGSGTLVGSLWVDIAVASDGALWFVTLGGGVVHFDGETWTHYTEDDGLNSNIGLSSIAGRGPLGGTGDMQWFATAEGVCRFDGETWTAYPESAHLAGGPGPLALGPDGALWYGTASGATRFDGEDWTTYTTFDGLATNYVLGILEGADGAMWFATNGGVSRFDGDTWTTYTTADGLAHDRIASLALAPDGALWFGTGGGVSRFDGKTWTTYTTADGLVNDDVSAVATAGSVLWFGTSGGVSRFEGETWTSFTTADGLVHDEISAVQIAPDGAVWFATEGGLSRYMPAEASDLGYSFSLDREVVDAFWNEDGSLSLAYEFTFSNDPFASPIEFVDVAIPSQDYQLEEIYAEVDGHVIRHIAESEFVAGAIELGLGENAIMAGATGRVSVQIEGIQRVLSADPGDD